MDQVRMGGEIQPGLVVELLQLLSSRNGAAGYLEVSSAGSSGRTWFRNGRMVDAQWGIRSGEAAVRDMLAIQDGRFRFVESDLTRKPSIHRDITCILLDGMRALDEHGSQPLAQPQPPPDPPPPPPEPGRAPGASRPKPPGTPKAPAPPSAAGPAREASPSPTPKARRVTRATRKRRASQPAAKPEPLSPPRSAVRAKPSLTQQLALAALLLVGFAISVVWIGASEAANRPATAPVAAVAAAPIQPEFRAPAPAPEPIRSLWPRFSLSGLLASGQLDGEGAAVVNGEVVSVGERINGMIVREIGNSGIILEYDGDYKFHGMTDDHKRSVNRPTLLQIYLSALRNFSFCETPDPRCLPQIFFRGTSCCFDAFPRPVFSPEARYFLVAPAGSTLYSGFDAGAA